MESHTLRFDICKDFDPNSKDQDALYITIKDHDKYGLKERIRRYFSFKKNWKSYIDGEDIISHGVLIRPEQIEALYVELIRALKEYNILSDDDIKHIENGEKQFLDKKITLEFRGKKDGKVTKSYDDTPVPFIGDDFVISVEEGVTHKGEKYFYDITFGYKLNENTTKKDVNCMAFYHLVYNSNDFIGGDFEGFMQKENVIKMLQLLYHLKTEKQFNLT